MNIIYKKSIKYIILLCVMINFSSLSYGTYYVDNNDDWNLSLYHGDNIVIRNGATLTINADQYFYTSTTITVNTGCKLVVNGATLDCGMPNELWGGIVVNGNRQNEQSAIYQGVVILNDAIIQNAECGLLVGKIRKFGTRILFISGGGIVQASNSMFINNIESAHFNQYIYKNPNNGNELSNISFFSNCEFILNNNVYFAVNNTNAQVYLSKVRGIDFKGCTFLNQLGTKIGIGIFSNEAGYKINSGTLYGSPFEIYPYYPSLTTFSGYNKAIFNLSTGTKPIIIYNVDFHVNDIGINSSNVNNMTVHSCQFNNVVCCLALEECNYYYIDNNFSNNCNYGIMDLTNYSIVNNNYIKYWTFQNICTAIDIYGRHSNGMINNTSSGLQIYCNKFDNNGEDIKINALADIALNQGTTKSPAGNIFGPTTSPMNINNNIQNNKLNYYYTLFSFYEEPLNVINVNVKGVANIVNRCSGSGYLGDDYYSNFYIGTINDLDDVYIQLKDEFDVSSSEYNMNYTTVINWDAYFSGDTSYQQQINDFNELSDLNASLQNVCGEALQIILSGDEFDKINFNNWVSRIKSPNMDLLLLESYIDERAIAASDSIFNNMLNDYLLIDSTIISNYKLCLNYLYEWNMDNVDSVDISQTALDSLNLIASGNGIDALFARSILASIEEQIPDINPDLSCSPFQSQNIPTNINSINKLNFDLKIKPNPTFDKIQINTSNNDYIIKRIVIYDIYGRQILSNEINSSEINIDLNEYSNGIYLIHCVMNDGQTIVKKVIKK